MEYPIQNVHIEGSSFSNENIAAPVGKSTAKAIVALANAAAHNARAISDIANALGKSAGVFANESLLTIGGSR